MSEWIVQDASCDWVLSKHKLNKDYKLYDKMTDTFLIFEYPDDLEQLGKIFNILAKIKVDEL